MKAIQIEVDGKEYVLGFFTRKDIKVAEKKGLKINKIEEEMFTQTDKLFYTSLLAKQPTITESEAEEIIEKFLEEGGDLKEIISFLSEQMANFMSSQTGKNKKKIVKQIDL
ncbi:MAG: DUF5055 domain-containing protein [Clostridia bacterium]|nr:DUF5055 domain-containing protein [Clostridia bacterium]